MMSRSAATALNFTRKRLQTLANVFDEIGKHNALQVRNSSISLQFTTAHVIDRCPFKTNHDHYTMLTIIIILYYGI